MKLNEGDMVKVEWQDSAQTTQIWHDLSEAKEKGRSFSTIKSIGFLVEESEEHVAIAQSWDDTEGLEGGEPIVSGLFQIPKGCITKPLIRLWERQIKSKKA